MGYSSYTFPTKKYLTHNDSEAFRGLHKIDVNETNPYIDNPVECPMCKAHGGWILERDAYGKDNHFMCMCSQCSGWGYVNGESADAICMHEWEELSQDECKSRGITHHGMCWHVYECKSCGASMSQDSSD